MAQVESKTYQVLLNGLLSHTVDEISVQEAIELENAVFVDSREMREYEVSHISNALFVGYDSLDLSPLQKVDKNKPIIIYCSVGYRSEKVAEKMKALGFTQVYNLYGGIFEWKNQNYPVVDLEGKETNQVHAYNRVWGIWLNKGEKVY